MIFKKIDFFKLINNSVFDKPWKASMTISGHKYPDIKLITTVKKKLYHVQTKLLYTKVFL